ncbi:MAG TPA: NAD(P)/FAD-dependent oxidoreductase [Chloroflexota bacterium]|nr:NAD(P)/FAD-dependent oxidoreductase [Chloroflexota bacterium]
MNVAVVGGGIAGLTAAYEMSKRQHQVTLYEAAPALGGQAGTFEVEGARLERFYHHLFMADLDMIDLVDQLGIASKLLWVQPKMGLYHAGRVFEFGTPASLLAFPHLGLPAKARFALATLFLMKFNRYQVFEGVSAWAWLRRVVGREAFEVIWGPMLEAKFSAYARQASMVWFWGKIALRGASRSAGKERLGYFNLSFQVLIDALQAQLVQQGVDIRAGCPIQEVRALDGGSLSVQAQGETRTYDKVVMALHNRDFLRVVPALPDGYVHQLQRIQYEGGSCLLLGLEHSLSSIYWMNISAPDMPFTAIVEHTNFMPPERYGGKHIVYLSRYMPPDDPMFAMSQDDLLAAYLPHLRKINPAFDPSWIRQSWLFRDSQAQPIITTGYQQLQPAFTTPIPNLYLANTTHIYPEDRGTNYAVRLGRQVAALLLGKSASDRYTPMIGAGKKPRAFTV